MRGFKRRNLDKNFFGQVAEEISDDLLVLNQPGGLGGVWNHLVLAIFVFGGNGFGRLFYGFVKISEQAPMIKDRA